MPFYALRIVCQRCAAAFVVGGSAEHDLSLWRNSVVKCQRCGADTPAAGGETVGLGTRATSVESFDRELSHA